MRNEKFIELTSDDKKIIIGLSAINLIETELDINGELKTYIHLNTSVGSSQHRKMHAIGVLESYEEVKKLIFQS